MESKGCTNIQVAIRMRPLITTEQVKKLCAQWGSQNNLIYQIDDSGHRHQFGEVYSFDHIFGTEKTNLDIYNDIVKDFVVSSLSGLNSTIFAYGQTSSGKTYTMLGDKTNMGIMTLAIENIFQMVENNKHRKYLLRVSYMEIYNEKINDLLDPSNKEVKIREFFPSTIGLQNIKEELVTSKEQMYECLKTGNLNRHISATKANDRSSRSHTIFKIVVESTETGDHSSGNGCIQISNLNLVDLAGSERVAQTKATGIRLKEGGHINKSLSALSLVIKQLSDGQEFVNFRDSKLTRLLQDSLGGNSKTLIIATITLASVEDTNSTLAFAQRAKTVKNKPRVNEILTEADVNKRNAALYAELQKKLEEQMMINNNFHKTEEEYFRKISNLQQQVKMLEDFQGARTPARCIPKRRHTIGFSTKKKILSRLPFDDFETSDNDSADITLFEDLLTRDPPSTVSKLETIREEDPAPINKFSTPENYLRVRLSSLEEEYNELASFTRNEDNIFKETAKKADELEQQLKEAQMKLLEFENQQNQTDFEKRELELQAKIKNLEEQLSKTSEDSDTIIDKVQTMEIMDALIHLQEILKNPCIFDSPECAPGEDSVLQIIKKFNVKAKTSKDIIETEILKQINSFDNGLQDQINFPNGLLESFNDLLNQLSLFESDIPADVIDNMKKETVEDFKVLIKIYESFLKKNEFIRNCAEKIKFLEEDNTVQCKEINILKNEKSELSKQLLEKKYLLETHNNDILPEEEIDGKVKENENLLQEIDKLKVLVNTMTDEVDSLNMMLNEKNNKILEVERNCKLLIQENEELMQKSINTCSENTSLRNDLNTLKKDFLESQEKVTKKCEMLEDEKLKLQQQVTDIDNEKQCLVNEINRINLDMDKCKALIKTTTNDTDNLNAILNEKNYKILEVEKNCASLIQENEELRQKSVNTWSENTNLKNELNKVKQNLLDSQEMVHKVTKNCGIYEDEINKLQQQITNIDEEKERLIKEVNRINLEMGKLKMLNNKILKLESSCALLKQENEELKQKSVSACSDNTSLKNELNKLKSDLLDSREIIDKVTKDCAILEGDKLKLQQLITNGDKEKERLVNELDRIKLVIDSQNRERCNFTLTVMEKNKVITETQNNYTKLKQEKETLEKEICAICDTNQYLKQEIEKIKNNNDTGSPKVKKEHTEALSSKLEEQEKVVHEIETKNSRLIQEVENFKRQCEDTVSENKILREEIQKVNTDLEFHREKIKTLQKDVNIFTTEIQSKNSSLSKLENDCTSLKDILDKLTQANCEKDKRIREIHTNNRKLTLEIQNLRDKLRNSESQSQVLKIEIEKLNTNKNTTLFETEEKCRHLELETEFANQKLNEMLLAKEQLTQEIEKLKKTVQDRQHVINTNEQKLRQNEQKLQKYKQLLEIAHKEINDLKEAVSDKEKLKCEIRDCRLQLSVSVSKLQECTKINHDLTLKLKELQMKTHDCDKNCTQNGGDIDRQFIVLNLRCTKKKLEDVLRGIIEQVVGEQKTLLLNRQSQDRRDGFKSVIRDLKSANAVLKSQLHLLQNEKDYDLSAISDNLLKSRCSFQQYVNLEKTFLQKQIEEVNSTNEQYLQEMITLKNSQSDISMTDCSQCNFLKMEVAKLRELPESQERMLNSLKDKNKMLEKENIDRARQVVGLQVKIYEEQDRKADVEYTGLLKFYRDNAKMQQKEIDILKQEIQQYKKPKEYKQSTGVQCNIIQEESQLQIKYNMIKQICVQRNEEIALLKLESAENKNSRNTEMQECNLKKENTLQKSSVAVQCDTFTEKYNIVKKLARMRREEILKLQAENAALKARNNVTES